MQVLLQATLLAALAALELQKGGRSPEQPFGQP